jgi:hypothetical protein
MDPNARQKTRQILWAIWRQVETCQSTFLSPSDLQAFGVNACQIDIADDGTLQFEPQFFKPHPRGSFNNIKSMLLETTISVGWIVFLRSKAPSTQYERASLFRKTLLKRLRTCWTKGLRNTTPGVTTISLMEFISILNSSSRQYGKGRPHFSALTNSPAYRSQCMSLAKYPRYNIL